jgi:hypothetical protein
VAKIASVNNITRRNQLYAGQVLHIPRAGAAVVVVQQTEPAKVKQPEKPVQVAMIHATPTVPESSSVQVPPPKVIVEKLSDSLKEISQVKADTLPLVQTHNKPMTNSLFDVSVYNLDIALSPSGNTATIHVSVDETVGHYADWLGLPAYRIRQLNHIGGGSEIRLNSHIVIPADQDLLARFTKARLEYHMALEEDFYSRYKVSDVRAKTIKRGEVLWTICNDQEQIPMWLFAKYNKHADLSTLQPGMQVWIPVVEEKNEQDIALESGQPIGIYPLFYEPSNNCAKPYVKRMP